MITPMRDERAGAGDFRQWAKLARERWGDDRYERALRDRTAFADEGEEFRGWEYLMPLARPLIASVFDYLRDTTLVVDEPAEVEKQIRSTLEELRRGYERAEAVDELALEPDKLFLTPDELRDRIGNLTRIELRLLGSAALAFEEELATEDVNVVLSPGFSGKDSILSPGFSRNDSDPESLPPEGGTQNLDAASAPSEGGTTSLPPKGGTTNLGPLFLFPPEPKTTEVEIPSRAVRRWHGRFGDLAAELKRQWASGYQTIVVLPSSGVADRISKALNEYDALGAASVIVGDLSAGFALPQSALNIYTEGDIFDEAVHGVERPAKTKRSQAAAFLSDFRDLKVGDYVVHIDHGIGQFQGLVQLDTSGPETSAEIYARMNGAAHRNDGRGKREFMLLTYADGAKLYAPVERLDLVQKYSSGDTHTPALDRLGGIAWQKTKARAKRAMRDMAEELLKLYAERRLVKGYGFSGDTPWQQEFESAFPYELTPDQTTAIADVKGDMEQTTPMDRLLCGDVGYGKTAVAMRAAFKAVMDGKQVAVLAPTTVLSYQHYQTFRSRFAAFPARVELLSRFRSPKEQKEVVEAVEAGAVDILIGTHRVLSRDVAFKELGLVIVDEEQRFGVAHKERLKRMKKRVDVLTMSATPIPRTLNMSLLGMRDMSLIETPPRDRLAIQTNVAPFAENIIRSAIEQELQRQGQVFFVHNRVESIVAVADLIRRIVPQARIIVAHGQMGEKEMEQAVLDFVDYNFDVLVATTIIENGIDIPRANTIIINRADAYGLSQLYQLRGRVGRSNRRAYAYLLIPVEQELSLIARRRLAAIREFSDLGAGFRIAALDLELRGAGNLLGGEQSGHLDALGFDLYTQMLERTVAELRGEQVEDETTVSINLGVDVAIPENYITDMGQRLRTYKRVSSAADEEALAAIRAETEDRYGRVPETVESLFNYARLRQAAENIRVVSIDRTRDGIVLKLAEKARVAPEKLLELVRQREGVSFTPSGVLRLELSEDEMDHVLEVARRVLLQVRADS